VGHPVDPLNSAQGNRRLDRRSLNSEAILVLESALDAPRMNEADLRRAILSIPSKARLSLAETRAAIREGRK